MIIGLLGLGCLCLPFFLFAQPAPRKVSADLTVQQLKKGQTYKQTASLYYKANGDLVSRFHPPLNYVLLNNPEGNIRFYDPDKNEVRLLNDPYMGSNTTYFYFFAHRKMGDMGLSQWGFTLTESAYEAPYQTTDWVPPANLIKTLSRIRLVHKAGAIVYMGYYHPTEGLFKKVYYGSGKTLEGCYFPETITSITYIAAGADSIVERSQFRNLQINAAADHPDFNFTLPADAKVVE